MGSEGAERQLGLLELLDFSCQRLFCSSGIEVAHWLEFDDGSFYISSLIQDFIQQAFCLPF